jgi:hypothetical protein
VVLVATMTWKFLKDPLFFGTLVHCWEIVWDFLKKLKIRLTK